MSFLDKVAKLFKDPVNPSKKLLIDSLKNKISLLEKQLTKEKSHVQQEQLRKDPPPTPSTGINTDSDKHLTETAVTNSTILTDETVALEKYNTPLVKEFDRTNKKFIHAVDIIENTNENIFLTGKAGTGKTTLLKHIVSTTSKQHAVLAYTGVAALNAGGNTIHSFFQMGFAPFIPNNNNPKFSSKSSILQHLRINKEKTEVIESLELIIIDEVSMVRCDVMDAIDTILRLIRNKPMLFGGVQMVFIGDLFQLSPIAKAEEWQILRNFYNTKFFFSAKCLQSYGKFLPYHYIELEKIYRQNDKNFVTLLNKVRLNNS